jgi:iron complex transport system ATP-binding protein
VVNTPALSFEQVSFRYDAAPVLRNVSVDIAAGEMVALLGPNGAGKSTFLYLAAGLHPATEGKVRLEGRDLTHVPPRERARRVALVPQQMVAPFAFTVREWVSLGRTPYLSPLAGERGTDVAAVESALEAAEITHLRHRLIGQLSGGEQQRAALAQALAQEPAVLLLDEATAHLDLQHQMSLLGRVRALNRGRGVTVIAAIHDPNLAALWFDRLVLLQDGAVAADGAPAAVLTEPLLQQVFGCRVRVLAHPEAAAPLIALCPDPHHHEHL